MLCVRRLSVSEWNANCSYQVLFNLTNDLPLLFPYTGTEVIVQVSDRLMRQYSACVVDSHGQGITCILYHCSTSHPNLVSFAFVPSPHRAKSEISSLSYM